MLAAYLPARGTYTCGLPRHAFTLIDANEGIADGVMATPRDLAGPGQGSTRVESLGHKKIAVHELAEQPTNKTNADK